MKTLNIPCHSIRAHLLVVALIVVSPIYASAQNLTWDANTGTTGIQNSDGTTNTLTWNTTNNNWWDGTANTTWVNSTSAIAQFGAPLAVTSNLVNISDDIVLKELIFRAVTSGTIASAQQFTLNGNVPGRIIDFGTNGLVQMEDRSSGGSQFIGIGSNLRLKGSNLRFQKFGAGTNFIFMNLSMTTNPDLIGNLTIGGSIYLGLASPGTVQNVDRVIVEKGGSVILGSAGSNYTKPFTLEGLGNSLLNTGTSYGAIRFTSDNVTVSGGILLTGDTGVHTNFSGSFGTTGIVINSPITDGGGNFAFHRFSFTRGDGTLTLSAPNTYGGATVLGRSGLGNSYSGGITILDFTAATAPQNNIIYNGLASPGRLDLIAGNSPTVLRLVGKSGDTHSQSFGNVTVNGTHSVLELLSGAGGTLNLNLGTLSRTDVNATLSVIGPASGAVTTTQASGFLGPWASYTAGNGGRTWAQVSEGSLRGSFVGSTIYTTGGTLSAAPFSSSAEASISNASTGNVTLGAGTTQLNTLSMHDLLLNRQLDLGTGQTLRLGTQGGIQLVNGAGDFTVGISGQTSTLSAGGTVTNAAGSLFLSNQSSSKLLTVNSNITNNGTGIVTLVSNGAPASRTVLTGTNTHTGGTQISSGILEVRSNGALGTTGTVTVMDGATLALSGGVTLSRALGAVGGFGDGNNGAIRSLSGDNFITGAISQNAMFMIAADAGASLTIQPPSVITFVNMTFGGAGTIAVNTALSGTGVTNKIGTGTLVLGGTNVQSGAINVGAGTLRLASANALGATTGVTISAGGTVDLNGQSTTRSFISIIGTGVGSGGALINTSATLSSITGAAALAAASNIGGSGNITINNTTGLTGNVLLTKIGAGTLSIIDSTTTSARTGVNQIDAGTLRVQSPLAIAPVGTGAYALNGGTLNLGFDVTNAMTNVVNLINDGTIIADRASSGAGGTVLTLGALTIGGNSLTVKPGDNVTSGTIGMTLGATTIGGVSMKPGNPIFDVQSTASAALTLTLGAISDQAIAPRTITFQNSGTTASTVILGIAATSLVDGTVVNINNGSNAGVTVNLNAVGALGSLSQVTVNGNSTLTTGITNVVLGSLGGSGTVNTTGAFTLVVGNAANATLLNSSFSGVLSNGSGLLTLTKAGKGTLTLEGSASNLYTGLTTVNSGTLVLAKTGGALAVGGSLTIGATAASTGGNATVRLEAGEQVINSGLLVMNAGSTFNLNGFTQTIGSISTIFGSTISGPAGSTLALANSSGTNTYGGISAISSDLQLTTGTSAQRTIAVTNVTDQLTISGNVTQGTTSGLIAKTLSGTLILSGNNTYSGATTITSGIINIRSTNALGTTAGNTVVSSGGTLQIQGSITTAAEGLSLNGLGFVGASGLGYQTGALVNMSGTNQYAGLVSLAAAATISSDSGTLNLTHVGTITGPTFGLTLAGAGDGSIASVIGITTGTVIKNGSGTWTLTGVNTSTGAITINSGTLKLGNGTTGRWSSLPGLTYTGTGTFQFGGSTAASTQALGALTITSGSGTLQVDAPTSGINGLTFTSLVAPALGSGLNVVAPTNTSVTLTGATDVNGIINARLTYNGADFASSNAGALGVAATTLATSSLTPGNTTPYLISGSFAQASSVIINAGLKFAASDTLTLNDGTLLTINNGAGTAGGILVTGGVTSVIANATSAIGLTTGGSGDLVIRTNTSADSLDIRVPITDTTTGGLTKNGAGVLTLSAPSTYTGATSINEGTLILGNATAMSASAATVRVGGVLNLNGQSIANAVTLNGTGIGNAGALINNLGSATVGALTLGTGFGTGAVGASIGGSGNIESTGALVGNVILVKTGAGTLTLGSSGVTAVPSTRTGATRIDAGVLRISNSTTAIGSATAPLILNGGTLSMGSSASVVAYPTAVTASSTIVSDVFTSGAGLVHTLGTLAIGAQTLTVAAGSNVTTATTNAGVTFGATTLTGNPVFDVQSPTTATGGTTTLTLGALNDQGVAKTITFANSGASSTNSLVTLGTAMASLVEGTTVNINSGTSAGVTLNLNAATALGTLARVTVSGNSIFNIGASQTIASLSGDGTVTASGTFTLTVGNANSSPALSTNFAGTLSNGTGILALTKNGLGTLTLTPAVATYTGATIVSAGILKLGNTAALGATSGVTISAGATVDLNGQTTDRNFSSISGTGHNGGGAIINSSGTTATLTGTSALGNVSKIGGTGNITVSNAGGLTGSVLLTKFGAGTLTFISTASSARTGTNQIDDGTLRLQAATAIATVGTGAMAMNGGTLSLGFDGSGTVGGAVNVLANSTIIADRATTGAGGLGFNLGALIIGGNTLTVKAGANVTSGSIGLTLGTTTLGGPSLAPGNPVFDVQSTSTAEATLTLGAITDQAIAPSTITFQNSGVGTSVITLGSAASSLVDGTVVNLASAAGAVTVKLNTTNALGTFANTTVSSGNILSLGASQTIASLNGVGLVTTTANSVLTIGNVLSPTVSHSNFSGVLAGAGLSIVKSGQGSLTLGGAESNTFAGTSGAVINSGTLILAKTGGAVAIPANLTLGTLNGVTGTAVLRFDGNEQFVSGASLIVNSGSSVNLNGFNQTLGNLNGTPGSTILNNATGTSTTLTIGGGNATGGQFLGVITDNSTGTGTVALTKVGSGSGMLGGWNTYTGATIVQSGVLQVGALGVGTTGTGTVTAQSTSTIFGTGVIQGSSFTASSGSTIHAGDGSAQANYGTLTFAPVSGSGAIDFQSGSTLILGIAPDGTSDLLNFVGTGSNSLSFDGNLTVGPATFTPVAEKVFNLLDWSGLFASPTFAARFDYTGWLYGNGDEATGLDLPDVSASSYYWDISQFTTQGTIALVMVPEPSRTGLLGAFLLLTLLRRNRPHLIGSNAQKASFLRELGSKQER